VWKTISPYLGGVGVHTRQTAPGRVVLGGRGRRSVPVKATLEGHGSCHFSRPVCGGFYFIYCFILFSLALGTPPISTGLGCFTISFLVSLYYNTVLTWVLWFFLNSFQHPLPWSTCPMNLNRTGEGCADLGDPGAQMLGQMLMSAGCPPQSPWEAHLKSSPLPSLLISGYLLGAGATRTPSPFIRRHLASRRCFSIPASGKEKQKGAPGP
jgi:hypothetical protein